VSGGLEVAAATTVGDLRLEVDLDATAPSTVAVLGPNGAGKTTLLRMLAGLHPVERGHVRLDGTTLDDAAGRVHVPTERRSVGFTFQDHLLFPHLSVVDNVAFGLRCRGVRRSEARAEAASWIRRVGLAGRELDRPSSLSGGEGQRIALARALALRPRLLLLDEPMAALDATTRATTRRDLREVLAAHEGVRIVVTHDPLEAMALADDLVVVERGRVVQRGPAAALAAEPRSAYVADLVGVNRIVGRGTGGSVVVDGLHDLTLTVPTDAPRGDVAVVFHPRVVSLHRTKPEGSARNIWPGRAVGIERLHDRARVRVGIGGGAPARGATLVVVAEVTDEAVRALDLERGGEVWASVKATELAVFAR